MFTVLVSKISNEQVLMLQKLLTFFSKNISVSAIFNDQSFNDTLTIDSVSLKNWALTYMYKYTHMYL